MGKLQVRDVKAIALDRFKRKQRGKTSLALAALLGGLLVFGLPAWLLSVDTNHTRVYESRWGEEVIVTSSQVTIEGMVLDAVEESDLESNKVAAGILVSLLLVVLLGGFSYLFYLVYLEPKFVNDFLQKWTDNDFEIPEE